MPYQRKLIRNAIAPPTRKQYESCLPVWNHFCDECRLDNVWNLTNQRAHAFIAHLYRYTDWSRDRISKTLTAITSLMLNYEVTWIRDKYSTYLLRGIARERIQTRRPKKPWSVHHCDLMYKYIIKKKGKYTKLPSLLRLSWFDVYGRVTALLVQYHGAMRTIEIAKSKLGPPLLRTQIEFFPNQSDAQEMRLNIDFSKTNQYGRRVEHILIPCFCERLLCGFKVPCAVCMVLTYLEMRDKHFPNWTNPKLDNFQPFLFVKSNNSPICDYNLRSFLKLVIKEINIHLRYKFKNFQLNAKHYSPYCNRVGRTTDACRDGDPEYMITALGRWVGDIWKKTYLSTDWADISMLSGVLQWDLRRNAARFVQQLRPQSQVQSKDKSMVTMLIDQIPALSRPAPPPAAAPAPPVSATSNKRSRYTYSASLSATSALSTTVPTSTQPESTNDDNPQDIRNDQMSPSPPILRRSTRSSQIAYFHHDSQISELSSSAPSDPDYQLSQDHISGSSDNAILSPLPPSSRVCAECNSIGDWGTAPVAYCTKDCRLKAQQKSS